MSRGVGTTSASLSRPLPGPLPSATAPLATPTPVRPHGGRARLASPDTFTFDTFDAQRSGEPSVVEVLGRALSRVVQWTSFARGEIGPDLAASWEQPDQQTLILDLDRAARWQERAPVNGRAFTAADLVAHIERTLSLAAGGKLPLNQRSGDFATIARVSAPADSTVTIATSRPDPFLIGTLASRFALVQAPEVVRAFEARWHEARPDQVIGTGPFLFESNTSGILSFTAFARGHRSPLLAGLEVGEPANEAALFEAKRLDEALTRDRRDATMIETQLGTRVQEFERFEESPVLSTLFVGSPPWNNPSLTLALSAALNRRALSVRLFGSRAAACGPASPATSAFALPDSELAAYPGYRAQYDADLSDAKARWVAAGGPALGPITIDFPSVFDPRYSASSVVVEMLNSALGAQFHAAVESYTTISQKVLDRRYGNGNAAFWFGWGPQLDLPDASRQLAETYSPDFATGAISGLGSFPDATAITRVESLSRQVRLEFDTGRRMALAKEIGAAVLGAGGMGVLPWLLQRSEVFRWPYYGGTEPTPFWGQHLDAGSWLDPSAASYGGRP